MAKEFNGELISADSRQIYRGLDIGTGKDHPSDLPLHLIDIIDPDQSFSVAQYHQLTQDAISDIISRHRLPIIVGGTGQYIDAITNPRPTFAIKPNHFLRFFLNKFPLKLLQLILRILDVKTLDSLNHSDSANPHRLIRKIEIAIDHFISIKSPAAHSVNQQFNILHLSLTAPNNYLYPRIDRRVADRIKLGLFDEIRRLLSKYSWTSPGLNTLAYKEFQSGFTSEAVDRWRYDEHHYLRRQKTWFKKNPHIIFIDISQPGHLGRINRIVTQWYNKS